MKNRLEGTYNNQQERGGYSLLL
jgi:hypothetical protein